MNDKLLIGVASCDITPPVGAQLVGYRSRPSSGLGHRLRAEAIVCRRGSAAWALITSDTIGYSRGMVQEIRRATSNRVPIQPDAIMVTGTHTHSGPLTLTFKEKGDNAACPALDRAYLDNLIGELAQMVETAYRNASDGCFEIARGAAKELGSNRRIQLPDGSWANEWQDPDGRHPGFFDPSISLVGVRRPDGSLDALLVVYGVHPVVLGPESMNISADYPGYMKDHLEASDLARRALFAQGAGANINPRVCIMADSAHAEAMGVRLAEIVADAIDELRPVAGDSVCSFSRPWPFESIRKNAGAVVVSEMQSLRIGEMVLLGIPGELFSEFNAMLCNASPFRHTIVISLANDYIGYLPTDQAMTEGAYEARSAPMRNVQEEVMRHAAFTFAAVNV